MYFENQLYAIKYTNNIKVFEVYTKDKSFILDLMKKNELITSKEDIEKNIKMKRRWYFLNKFDVQKKKLMKNHILISLKV